jgi:hypothetical protein
VRVPVLPEPRVGRGDADVAGQVDFVAEIPGVAVRHDHDRFRAVRRGVAEGIERRHGARRTLAGDQAGLRRVDVDAAGEILAVAEQDERAQREVVRIDKRRPPDAPGSADRSGSG